MKLSKDYLHCIGTTYSVEEIVNMYDLEDIDTVKGIAKNVIDSIRESVPVRKNWQYISHVAILSNGTTFVLVPTRSWSDGDGGPVYVFHFHALYKKDYGKDEWKIEDVFCAKEFEPKWFKQEREMRECCKKKIETKKHKQSFVACLK